MYDDETPTTVVDIKLKRKDWAAKALTQAGEVALKHISDYKNSMEKMRNNRILRITVPCEFWFEVKVVEGGDFWDEFWKINDALEFNQEILWVGKTAKHALLTDFSDAAREKARRFGYQFDKDLIQHGGYHVVHLRAEQDWQAHCKVWLSWREKRDNCINNTFSIGMCCCQRVFLLLCQSIWLLAFLKVKFKVCKIFLLCIVFSTSTQSSPKAC